MGSLARGVLSQGMDALRQAELNPIVRCITGSRAYGTSTPASDLDIRGVFAAAPISLMTPFHPVEQVQGPGDTVLFELMKYVRLVCDQNPNIVELLWVEPSDVLFEGPAWHLLRDRREQLLTTRVRTTYGGFATQALKAMKGHERWLNKPQPEQAPLPSDFVAVVHNFSLGRWANSQVPREGNWTAVGLGQDFYLLHEGGSGTWHDGHGNLRTFTREVAAGITKSDPAVLVRFDRKDYEARKRDHENYWTWLRNRNKDRSALEEKRGFDAKNGAHLIRLLRTAHEILTEGVVRVRRPDAAELLRIRQGEVPYEAVVEMAAGIEAGLPGDEAASNLPSAIDQAVVGEVVMEMYECTWAASRSSVQSRLVPASAPASGFSGGGAPDVRGRVVVVDVEMTGFADAGRNQVVELGAVEIMGGRPTGRTFHAYVNPQARFNPFATQVHRLTPAFLADKPLFAAVAPAFLEFLGSAPLVAHNAETDVRALNNDLQLAGMPPLPPGRAACSMRLAAALLGIRRIGLDALCDVFGVDRTPRSRGHSATMDVSLLAQCVLRMADMPGYGDVKGAWVLKDMLRTRATRRNERRQDRAATMPVAMAVTDGGKTVRFLLADGTSLEGPVPDYPARTHKIVEGPGPRLLVVGREDNGQAPAPGRGPIPHNPGGPSIVMVRHGVIDYVHPRSTRRREEASMVAAEDLEGSNLPSPGR